MVDDQQHDAQEEADGAHGDVGDAQEWVLASHPGDGAQDHPLPALKAANRVIWFYQVKGTTTTCFSFKPSFKFYKNLFLFFFMQFCCHDFHVKDTVVHH